MNEQHASIDGAPNDGQSTLYMKRALFGEVADLIRTHPKAATVMLTLVASVISNGAVRTTQAVVADQCDMTLKDVGAAIAHLSRVGLISAVGVSPEAGGLLTCVVRPGFATAEKPEDYL